MKTGKTNRASRATKVVAGTVVSRLKGKYVLRLFVAGATARSRQAVLRVRELCDAEMHNNGTLEVIDIYQQPQLARANQIVATPTLVIELPKPVRRFIGSLASIRGLFTEINLSTAGEATG